MNETGGFINGIRLDNMDCFYSICCAFHSFTYRTRKLMEAGAKDAFLKLKQKYPNVCLVHLYTLEGAIQNIAFNSLSEDKKREWNEFSDFLFSE